MIKKAISGMVAALAVFMPAALIGLPAPTHGDPVPPPAQANPQQKDRSVYERWINTGWRFERVDGAEPAGARDAAYDDSQWTAVTLPHTPRIEKYDQPTPWQGICWYRKTLASDPAWAGKRVAVQFGAAMQIADVWVNGRLAAHHLGGYLPFMVDITNEAHTDAPVVIAARLDNRDTDLVPPGKPTDGLDFNYPGGLYRGVKLIVTDPVHVSDPVEANVVAGGGVFVQYSDVSNESATVHVQTDVANASDDPARSVTVRQRLVNPASGQAVNDITSAPVVVTARSHAPVRQTFDVDQPRLWDPDHPNLYTLVTTIAVGGVPVDEVRTTIGIRTILLDNRVRINGKEFHLAGSNRHQEHP
jgi:beta-galactosidase